MSLRNSGMCHGHTLRAIAAFCFFNLLLTAGTAFIGWLCGDCSHRCTTLRHGGGPVRHKALRNTNHEELTTLNISEDVDDADNVDDEPRAAGAVGVNRAGPVGAER